VGIWWSRTVTLGKQLARQAERKNVHLARARYHGRLHRETLRYRDPPVLLYQMGKVGSKTIRDSLQAIELDRPVFHVHFLSPERVKKMARERRRYFGTEKQHLLRHIWQYQYLRKRIAKGLDGEKWKIVTLTREPISKNISTFFENLEIEPLDDGRRFGIQSDYYDFDIVVDLENTEQLVQLFFDRLYHDRPLVFFDQEIKRVFGIDVFSSEFPVSKGFKIYREEHAEVLLVRLEDLNDCARGAFKEFLNIDNLTLLNTNVGSQKIYAPLYRQVLDAIVLPESYVERIYASKYMRHFYSKAEILKFRARWSTSRS
jgi:putative capsular polysaccharide synthesis protein